MPAKSSIGASAVQLTVTATPVRNGTLIVADPANTGKVYVGLTNAVTAGTADATDGVLLAAGSAVVVPPYLAPDSSSIWLIASAGGQKVFWATDMPIIASSGLANIGSITVGSEVEVKNDSGNPVPVAESWGALSAGTLLLTGDGTAPTLKNLAGGALVLSAAYDNTTSKVANANLDLRMRGQGSFAATTMDLWILPSLDGTVYEDGDASVTPARSPDANFSLRGITTAQVLILAGLQIPPTKVKFLVRLNGSIALTNTNGENTLTLYTNQ